jgi:hypothetical protein
VADVTASGGHSAVTLIYEDTEYRYSPEPGSDQAGVPVTAAARDALLAAAGALAGTVGAAGGITSLISYPALLWAGVPALQANVANIVALVACWPGSAVASRQELKGKGPWLRRWIAVSAAGGTAGSLLLLSTPAGVFSKVVPFLVAAGSLTLLKPGVTAGPREGASGSARLLLPCGVVALSAYNGYFGAGSGVMLLALMLATADPVMTRANALKNMLLGAASIASAVIFAVLAKVDWAVVAPLAAGMLAGSAIGPRIARRVPPGLLRWLVALTGLGLAARLWISGGQR